MLAMLGRMAEEQLEASAADVDGMSYEELQALGESIGKVTVRSARRAWRCAATGQSCGRWRRGVTCTRSLCNVLGL